MEGIGAKGRRQAFIEKAGGAMQRRDQPRPHAVGSVGVVVDLEGVATSCGVGFANAPVGAGIIAVDNRAQGRIVEADRQAPPLAQGNDRLGGEQVPVELVAHGGLHRFGPAQVHSRPRRAGATDPLGIGMASQHQNLRLAGHGDRAQPVFAQAAAGPRQRIDVGDHGSLGGGGGA